MWRRRSWRKYIKNGGLNETRYDVGLWNGLSLLTMKQKEWDVNTAGNKSCHANLKWFRCTGDHTSSVRTSGRKIREKWIIPRTFLMKLLCESRRCSQTVKTAIWRSRLKSLNPPSTSRPHKHTIKLIEKAKNYARVHSLLSTALSFISRTHTHTHWNQAPHPH